MHGDHYFLTWTHAVPWAFEDGDVCGCVLGAVAAVLAGGSHGGSMSPQATARA